MRITRTEYLNKLIAFKDKQLIKVVTGIRLSLIHISEPTRPY